MIDYTQVDYVDVHSVYFGMDVSSILRFECLFDEEKRFQVNMNHVISKPYAIEKARSLYEIKRSPFTNLYISRDAVSVKRVKDYMGTPIFPNIKKDVSGWLFFFDPIPFANWEHPCNYLFLIDENNYEEKEYNKGLCEEIQMEKIY